MTQALLPNHKASINRYDSSSEISGIVSWGGDWLNSSWNNLINRESEYPLQEDKLS